MAIRCGPYRTRAGRILSEGTSSTGCSPPRVAAIASFHAVIRLQDVEKSFRSQAGVTPVLRVPAFQVAAGEHVALIGASGSGKTTLLNLLSGLDRADSGVVEVAGQDLTRLSESERDRFRAQAVGYMFQSFHLLDGFSAVENVELGESFAGRKVDRGQAERLLASLELGHRLDYKPSELSIGQQARVALARALAGSPQLILADEPTGALDGSTAETILTLLLARARELGATLVVATHDPAVAAHFDRTVAVEELNELAPAAGQEASA
ncbi:MAG: ABC transporter ATP-binding protein [Planctomycetes bacterium]|nr:ABC transporter ATP-binding protein [Planctomycetota bacterium]